jgi:hypothetical protein
MTDNEIVKALECCASGDDGCEKGCPLQGKCISPIRGSEQIMQNALDLINRLQEENERLNFVRTKDQMRYQEKTSRQAETNCALYDLHDKAIKEVKELEVKLKTAKSEAYKEFAERLKEKYGYYDWENKCIVYPEDEIDNLLKELVGETK